MTHPTHHPILSVQGLKVYFDTDDGIAKAVDGISFTLERGQTLGIVGESGCGKSVTSLAMMRLVPQPPGHYAGGKILFDGTDLLSLSESQMQKIRGNRISMIFQEPMSALNPLMPVGRQVAEVLIKHQELNKTEAIKQTIKLLDDVGIPSASSRIHDYPHQLSGGMKQRVMIAMALACKPDLLIADEPTTALDVTVQAQILDLLRDRQRELGMSIILITHDLGIVAEMTDEVIVMYAGRVVEHASTIDLYRGQVHPYTRGLFGAIPSLNIGKDRLAVIPGSVPSATDFPDGCRFAARCSHAQSSCTQHDPILQSVATYHEVACPITASPLATHIKEDVT